MGTAGAGLVGRLSLALGSSVILVGCSQFNRRGPDATCADLGGGSRTVCEEGIIARCVGGEVEYEVCTDEVEGVAAEDLCGAGWQIPDGYTCQRGPANIRVDAVEVEDRDLDRALSPGESVTVHVSVRNAGSTIATDIVPSLKNSAPLQVISCETGDYGCDQPCDCTAVARNAVEPQQVGYSILDADVFLPASAPIEPITVQAEFRDAEGHLWTDSFTLPVVP